MKSVSTVAIQCERQSCGALVTLGESPKDDAHALELSKAAGMVRYQVPELGINVVICKRCASLAKTFIERAARGSLTPSTPTLAPAPAAPAADPKGGKK